MIDPSDKDLVAVVVEAIQKEIEKHRRRSVMLDLYPDADVLAKEIIAVIAAYDRDNDKFPKLTAVLKRLEREEVYRYLETEGIDISPDDVPISVVDSAPDDEIRQNIVSQIQSWDNPFK